MWLLNWNLKEHWEGGRKRQRDRKSDRDRERQKEIQRGEGEEGGYRTLDTTMC